MSILQCSGFLHGVKLNRDTDSGSVVSKGKQQYGLLRPKSSLANLIHFVRNPLENVGETVEQWRDGHTKEERARKQSLQDKKQLLYLRLREVRVSKCSLLRPSMLTEIAGNELRRLASSSNIPRRH